MKVHNCPSCNTYSKECIIVIQNAPHFSEERLVPNNLSTWSILPIRLVTYCQSMTVFSVNNIPLLLSSSMLIYSMEALT